jgi:putative membrane protein
MLYLIVKALHVIFVVAWFAGVFYLPRLFVYHADATDPISDARFKVMERRLYALMTFAGVGAATFGALLLVLAPAWLAAGWLNAKLALVAGLVVYHIYCGRLLSRFRDGRNVRTSRWFRVFNEIPALFLVLIVLLVIVKPF